MRNPELESSSTLLERAKTGDRDALDKLCERYLPRLRRWARGRLPESARDLTDTDDLVQETLVGTIQRLHRFDARWPGAFQAYVRKTLLNRLRDELRRAGRRPVLELLAEEDEAGAAPTPFDLALGREKTERYLAALGRLSDQDQEVIVSRLEMGCTYAEVGDLLGMNSADAARMALGRAVLRLAREMRRGNA
jgi:RNA polymerase sigma-70 factor (ECF subfamily)